MTSASVKSYQLVKVVSGGRAPGKSLSLASPQLLVIEQFHCFGAVRLDFLNLIIFDHSFKGANSGCCLLAACLLLAAAHLLLTCCSPAACLLLACCLLLLAAACCCLLPLTCCCSPAAHLQGLIWSRDAGHQYMYIICSNPIGLAAENLFVLTCTLQNHRCASATLN